MGGQWTTHSVTTHQHGRTSAFHRDVEHSRSQGKLRGICQTVLFPGRSHCQPDTRRYHHTTRSLLIEASSRNPTPESDLRSYDTPTDSYSATDRRRREASLPKDVKNLWEELKQHQDI